MSIGHLFGRRVIVDGRLGRVVAAVDTGKDAFVWVRHPDGRVLKYNVNEVERKLQ